MDYLESMMLAADQALDRAWTTGHDLTQALERAKRLSVALGREPLIEEAKLLIADAQGCRPSEAFLRLVAASQLQNCKLAQLARELVATAEAISERRQLMGT